LVRGLAGAAMVPRVLVLISLLFGPHERARALSVFGVVIGIGAGAGQALGGVIINADLSASGGGRSANPDQPPGAGPFMRWVRQSGSRRRC
jgi:MFS family permease